MYATMIKLKPFKAKRTRAIIESRTKSPCELNRNDDLAPPSFLSLPPPILNENIGISLTIKKQNSPMRIYTTASIKFVPSISSKLGNAKVKPIQKNALAGTGKPMKLND